MGSAAYGASESWSGTVDSGGAAKTFATKRTSTQNVVISQATGGGGLTINLVRCDNASTFGSAVKTSVTSGSKSFGATSKNQCFRLKMARTNPADTNGALPGWGVTNVLGSITW